jgi:EpsI family protein
VEKGMNELYSQVLVRTYVNANGEHVMLSVAYGGDQNGNLALHKPEHCYGSQGFEISNFQRDDFKSDVGNFPVTRLLAVQGHRSEPITYWTTVGDKVVRDGLDQKLQKLRFAMTGKIPDGILVRVSTLDDDMNNSYRIQNSFIQNMLASMNKEDRAKIIGTH